MVSVTTSIKVDPTVKAESQALFERLGLSWSTAINLFLRQAIREQAIPFRVGEPMYNEETLRTIREAEAGINLRGPYNSVEELVADLESDDGD
ncbi:MAG: type II toxin-antitoxin system RelB/DinJ family antitoxin [Oscillibacter sp.]|nr:type II toxin-antitoxin system RelB/DinJ family antitoxin [Oscillibacter sp.]